MEDMDRAQLMAYAVNKPDELDRRRNELRAKLRHDPSAPPPSKPSMEEMRNAAMQIMALIPKPTMPS